MSANQGTQEMKGGEMSNVPQRALEDSWRRHCWQTNSSEIKNLLVQGTDSVNPPFRCHVFFALLYDSLPGAKSVTSPSLEIVSSAR